VFPASSPSITAGERLGTLRQRLHRGGLSIYNSKQHYIIPALFLDMHKIILVVLLIGLSACTDPDNAIKTKILDFGTFTIEVPESWKKIAASGIDSYIGSIAIDNNDTLHFDLGWYSNNLYEWDVTVLDSSLIPFIDTNAIDINAVIFVKDKSLTDRDKYRKNNVRWDTIGGYASKIVYPRLSGTGTTGIYIDSLWSSGSTVDRFNLYGENLQPENEKKVLKALQTLKFIKK
jgi:hypothetical protein